MGTLIDDLRVTADESRMAGIRPDVIRIKLKEKLQLYLLDFIYNNPKYNHLILYGGTCLRKCFGGGRMSEDVDCETTSVIDKGKLAGDIERYFREKMSYKDVKIGSPGRKIDRVEVRFPLLNAIGLSLHAAENLILKLEINRIDRDYPTELKTLSEDRFSFVVRHYDLPTLMAGKMLACLERVWKRGTSGINIKGRDYFDLIWYMQKGVKPNPDRLLHSKSEYTIRSAFSALADKASRIKLRDIMVDLDPLFEDGAFVKSWVAGFHGEFERLLKNYK